MTDPADTYEALRDRAPLGVCRSGVGLLDAMTTLGLMEKVGRGKWAPTEAARRFATLARTAPPSAPVEVDEVAAFEAWARCQFKGAEAFDRIDGRPGGWEYNGDMVQAAWAAWQQRSCLAKQPAAVG